MQPHNNTQLKHSPLQPAMIKKADTTYTIALLCHLSKTLRASACRVMRAKVMPWLAAYTAHTPIQSVLSTMMRLYPIVQQVPIKPHITCDTKNLNPCQPQCLSNREANIHHFYLGSVLLASHTSPDQVKSLAHHMHRQGKQSPSLGHTNVEEGPAVGVTQGRATRPSPLHKLHVSCSNTLRGMTPPASLIDKRWQFPHSTSYEVSPSSQL